MQRRMIGIMTGTSIDGLDAALVSIEGSSLAATTVHYERGLSLPLGDLAEPLRALANQQPATAGQIADLSRRFSLLHAHAITTLAQGDAIAAACVHGQTVFHQPPTSWQLINAPLIAHTATVKVVADLRAADLALGGQGAPLTPLSDWVMFRDRQASEHRAVVNLGGFANATVIDASGLDHGFAGFDLCACNQLLDLVARRTMGTPFDAEGRAALSAEPDSEALDDLLGILRAQSAAGRSLGTGDEAAAWIGRHWRGGSGCAGPALAASACEAIAQTIADRTRGAARLILAGGGVRNAALVRAITSCASCRVEPCDVHGFPPAMREAAGWAVLGDLALAGLRLPLAHVTGARGNVRAGIVATP